MVPRVLPSEPFYAAEIVDSRRGSFTPYTGKGPRWTLLRLQLNNVSMQVVLPNSIRFDAIFLEPGPEGGPNVLIHFATDRGWFTGCPSEFSMGWPPAIPPPDDARLEQAFLNLKGQYTPPADPPDIAAFTCKHIGLVAPDRWGIAEGKHDAPRLSKEPVDLLVEYLGPEDVPDIDAVLDRFFGNLDAHLSAATPYFVENMRQFARAVYRDPDGPPVTDVTRDEPFELMLALDDPAKIWDHVQPYAIRICRDGYPEAQPAVQRVAEGPIFVTLLCHCDWEIEHGVGLVWRNGDTLSAVGSGDVRVSDGL